MMGNPHVRRSATKREMSTENQGRILSADRISNGWPLNSDGAVDPRSALEPDNCEESIFDDVNGERH
jgi:hypothetical protein